MSATSVSRIGPVTHRQQVGDFSIGIMGIFASALTKDSDSLKPKVKQSVDLTSLTGHTDTWPRVEPCRQSPISDLGTWSRIGPIAIKLSRILL
jgi:hypothetical protein